jgi:hypothetical protein
LDVDIKNYPGYRRVCNVPIRIHGDPSWAPHSVFRLSLLCARSKTWIRLYGEPASKDLQRDSFAPVAIATTVSPNSLNGIEAAPTDLEAFPAVATEGTLGCAMPITQELRYAAGLHHRGRY